MLSSLTARSAHDHDLLFSNTAQSQRSFLHDISATCCSVAKSMNYITSALAARPSSAKSQESSHSNHFTDNGDSIPEARSLKALTTSGDVGSITSPKVKRHSTFARSKTTLHFCRPPPTIRQKRLHIRPKVLLQLHRTSEATRPIPAFDVLSTSGLASRLAKEFPSTFKGKHILGIDDLVVVGSEDYSSEDVQKEGADDGMQKDNWKTRDIVAAIAQYSEDKHDSRRNCAEICLSRGRSWTGSPMPKGGYEFVSVDMQGLRTIARWVPRRGSQRHSSGQGASSSILSQEEKAFNFSLIDPSSRRHAVIATFDTKTLEVSDRYHTPLAKPITQSPTATPEKPPVIDDSVEVDEALRILITVTSIWVSFCEGAFGQDHATAEPAKSPALAPDHMRRSLSVKSKGIQRNSAVVSRSPGQNTVSKRPSSIQESASSLTAPLSPVNTPIMSPPFLSPPRRTQSAGTAVLSRLHSHRTSGRNLEALSTTSDPADIPSYNSQTSATLEQPRISHVRGGSSAQLSKPSAEQRKRPKGIKKLCCSIKNSVSSGSSE